MKRPVRSLGVLVSALALAAAAPVFGATRFVAHLDGSQEVPPVATTATGEATVHLNDAHTEIGYTLTVTGIDPAAITAAHIHVGIPGVNGPVIFTLSAASGTLTSANLEAHAEVGVGTFEEAITAVLNGQAYINVHSTAFPDGEIRGQIGMLSQIKVRKAINPRSNGVIKVAFLSTPDFDASGLDPDSVQVGSVPPSKKAKAKTEDVNGDGLADLVFFIRTQDSGIVCGDTSLSVVGFTSTGLRVEGTARIKTPGCH